MTAGPIRTSCGLRSAFALPLSRSASFRPLLRPLAIAALFAVFLLYTDPARADNTVWESLRALFGSRSTNNSKYHIYDSRTVAHTFGAGNTQFYWVDNDELVFVAMQIVPDTSRPNKERTTYAIKRWNTKTGGVRLVRDFGEEGPSLCVLQGYALIYLRRRDNTFEIYHGPLGAEKPDDPRRRYNYLLCRPADQLPPLPPWTEGREIRWLGSLDGGFIDFGNRQESPQYIPLRLYKHGARQSDGIELPLYKGRVKYQFPFYQFQNAFFVEGHWYQHPHPKNIPYEVHWLYSNGRVEKIADIPWGPWRAGGSFAVTPTRVGLLMSTTSSRSETDLGDSGIYLLKNGKVERIVTAWVQGLAISVSPDGCKAAFTSAAMVTMKQNVLQAIELCSGG